jgi:hypothetical protein
MINSLNASAALEDALDQRSPRNPEGEDAGEPETMPPEPAVEPEKASGSQSIPAPELKGGAEPNFRFVIDHDADRGGLTYKLIDRTTGETVSEIPREDLAKMTADPSYIAGAVLDTKA